MQVSEFTVDGKKIGDFVLLKLLGKGQFGKVFFSRQVSRGTYFAVKQINKQKVDSNKKLLSLLKTEVSIMQDINHRNIMKLYDFLETPNNYYMVMQYCNEGDISVYMKNKKLKFFDEAKAVYFLKQIMNGFEELRKKKILHRDIKLENLFLHNGEVIIGDFGFAKKGSLASTKLGTPVTMAYELLNPDNSGKHYDSKADLWSIAVVYYEMLFGCLPFNGKNMKELVKNIEKKANGNLKFPRHVSNESKDFLNRILVTNPDKRMSWYEFFHHKLFTRYQIDSQGKSKQYYEATGNRIMAQQMEIEDDFQQNRANQHQGDMNHAFLSQDKLIEYGDGLTLKPSMVEEESLDKKKTNSYCQQWDFKDINYRYLHENEIVLFFIYCLKRVQSIIKSCKYNQLAFALFDISILLLRKAIMFNTRAFDSLNSNKNIFDLNSETFMAMISSPYFAEIYAVFSTYEKKLEDYGKIIEERISIFKIEPSLITVLRNNDFNDIKFIDNNLSNIYEGIKKGFDFSTVKKEDQKDIYLTLFCVNLCANSNEKFPFLLDPPNTYSRFRWKKFYKAIEGLNETELIQLILG